MTDKTITKPKKKSKNGKITINTGAFVRHLDLADYYTQHFDNQFLSIGIKISPLSYFQVGSLLNSFGERGILLGIEKIWKKFNEKCSFEGVYAYTGQFLSIKAFEDYGNRGTYKDLKKKIGAGWAPYMYHGIKYKVLPYLNLQAGFLLTFMLVGSIQWVIF